MFHELPFDLTISNDLRTVLPWDPVRYKLAFWPAIMSSLYHFIVMFIKTGNQLSQSQNTER